MFIFDHLWFELLLLAVGITAVFLAFTTHRVPRLDVLSHPSPPGANPSPRDEYERELQTLGFHHLGDYDSTMTSSISMILRAYASPDMFSAVIILDIKTTDAAFTKLEFSTLLKPCGSISTNNYDQPSVFSYATEKIVINAPWKKNATELRDLHFLLVEAAKECSFYPVAIHPGEFADRVREVIRRDFERQVEKGRMKRVGTDQYRLTLLGSLLATPKVWFRMSYGILVIWFRPSDEALQRKTYRRLRSR